MDRIAKYQKHKKIGGLLVITGILLLLLNYLFLYNIPADNIEEFIGKKLIDISKGDDVKVNIIDEYKTEYGLVTLFKTGVADNPIGYAVFEKDGFLNRYFNEDFAVYLNENDYIGDSDAIIDLKNLGVFKFEEDKIIEMNSSEDKKALMKYYFECFLIFALLSGGIVMFCIADRLMKSKEEV